LNKVQLMIKKEHPPMGSEIVRFREQQELTEQAAVLGLSGYAITSPHEFIEKRMELGAVYLQQLMDTGRHDEAFALMETDGWQGVPLHRAHDKQEGRIG
jgi:hypothetical protein